MKKLLAILLVLCLVLVAVPAIADDGESLKEKAEKFDRENEFVTVGTGPTSGIYFPIGGAFATALGDYGYQTSAEATNATGQNIQNILKGDCEIAIAMQDAVMQAYTATGAYEGKEAASDLRALMRLWPNYVQLVTTANTGIKSVNDLKGKRVGVGAANSGVEINARMILAAYGITYDDITPDYLAYGEAIDNMKNGQCDAVFVTSGLPNATVMELGVSYDMVVVPIDGEGREKLVSEYPYYSKTVIPANTYNNKEDVEGVFVYNIMLVRKDLPDEMVYDLLTGIFQNISTIKAMDLSPQFMHKWEEMLAHYMRAAFEQAKFQVVITGFSGVIQSLSSIGVLWYGGHMVMAGEFTLGQLIAFQMLAGQAMEPLKKLLTIWPQVQQTGMALERMGDILATPREPVLEEQIFNLPKLQGKIDIEHLYFRYRPDMPWVLSDISLHIAAGEKVAVIGPSGSGKSTLSKLLQGLYIPDQGEILLDDRINLQYPLSYLRRQIGAVIQESYLFNGSIRENIALAAPGTGMQKIIEAARLAGAHEFILELEDGYDTNVGEQGMALSGGQRQRIAIARMLLMDAGLLIFDEATSALDYASERSLMENLERIRQGRTMLVIAHRISMAACCDRVLVLDKGKIVDSGTPAELADRPGIYRDLCIQQKGME